MTEKKSNIKVDDLLVGEHNAMNLAAVAWGALYKIKQPYLISFIARMEKDVGTQTQLTMPLFKMILFFAQHLQEHTKNCPELMKAIEDAQMRHDMEAMFGGPTDAP